MNARLQRFLFYLSFSPLLLLIFVADAYSEDISLSGGVVVHDDVAYVVVANKGRALVQDVRLSLELNGKSYRLDLKDPIEPGKQVGARCRVDLPSKPGSYPLFLTVTYANAGARSSLLNVVLVDHQQAHRLQTYCGFEDIKLTETVEVNLTLDKRRRHRLFLPEEIKLEKSWETDTGWTYQIRNLNPSINLDCTIFCVIENATTDVAQASSIFKARLFTRGEQKKAPSLFSARTYFACAASGLIFSLGLFLHVKRRFHDEIPPFFIALLRWSFSVFVISSLFFASRTLRFLPDHLLKFLRTPWVYESSFRSAIANDLTICLKRLYFSGGDFDYFFQYIANPLFFYILLGNFFVLYFLIKPRPETDKNWHLMQFVFSLIPGVRVNQGKAKVFWSKLCKIAILTLMVKVFYVPIMSSWTVNNIIHAGNLCRSFTWDFHSINDFLVHSMILVDVFVFAVAYIVELPQLKNGIRSVEPTLFGWVVCLICYPPFRDLSFQYLNIPLSNLWQTSSLQMAALPFNDFSFQVVDIPLGDVRQGGSLFWTRFALVIVTILWAIYLWATIALGWKASNLTNRGIVSSGPYRYVRHPAYFSKLSLWLISSIFLGEQTLSTVMGLILIYSMRAWTEERHLSLDPEYVSYREKVRWGFIPGVI